MSVATRIEQKLRAGLPVAHLELVNESHMHNVPAGSESHFKLVLVSGAFEGQRLVRRHQTIYGLLAEEMQGPVHALTMHPFTPEEWAEREGTVANSPACRGGSQHDKEAGQ